MRKLKAGGGWPAILYTLEKAQEAGGLWSLWKALRTRNACKTCAVGMGGQAGGMVNEAGHFPEVCKKSVQAMVADMQGAIPAEFFQNYSVPQLQRFSPRELEACGRLTRPLVVRRGEQFYRPLDWDPALDEIAARLRQAGAERSFWYFSGRSSNEAGFLLQLFARVFGTNNVNNCSYYCHQASGVGLSSALGTGTATITLEDLDRADLVLLIGGNPASNHPRLMRSLVQLRRRGGEVIVVNPVVETGLVNFRVPSDWRSLLFGSRIASQYVQPHVGGDLALLTGAAKRVLELAAHDEAFLNRHCQGWPELAEHLRQTSWEEIHRKSGVPYDQIDELARRYARARNVVFAWTMGITHHVHGVENVQAIVNLALLRGMAGRPGAGLMPIRGHSNVQGIGTVGVTPQLKAAVFERLQDDFGLRLPTAAGLDTIGCLEAALAGQMDAGFCLGGNLFGASPDARFTADSLARLNTLVYLNTTLNTGHAHGLGKDTFILPVLARDEEPEPTTQESMFNFVRLSDGGPARHVGPRSEVALIADLAHRVLGEGGPIDWREMSHTGLIRQVIARIVPGLAPIARIDQSREEFHVEGRILHEPNFPTTDGRARLFVHPLPELSGGEGQLRLMTVRSEGQFNTVVYEDYDLYRGQERRDVILVHPEDLHRLGLSENQRVTVRSSAGSMEGVLVRAFAEIKPGNALAYYPEANVLVPRSIDPASRTPAYKNVVITIEPAAPAPGGDRTRPQPAAEHQRGATGRSSMKAC